MPIKCFTSVIFQLCEDYFSVYFYTSLSLLSNQQRKQKVLGGELGYRHIYICLCVYFYYECLSFRYWILQIFSHWGARITDLSRLQVWCLFYLIVWCCNFFFFCHKLWRVKWKLWLFASDCRFLSKQGVEGNASCCPNYTVLSERWIWSQKGK